MTATHSVPLDSAAGGAGGAPARRPARLVASAHNVMEGAGVPITRVLPSREAGYRRLWLSVEPSNRPAIRSYQNAGFRQLPGSLWAPEIDMALDLEATEARPPASSPA